MDQQLRLIFGVHIVGAISIQPIRIISQIVINILPIILSAESTDFQALDRKTQIHQ